jgi:hypothetical protein
MSLLLWTDKLPSRVRALVRRWWARHICSPDPYDAALDRQAMRAADVLAQHPTVKRVIPMPCRKPRGVYEMGWTAFGQSDPAIVEVICAWERALPPLTHKEAA